MSRLLVIHYGYQKYFYLLNCFPLIRKEDVKEKLRREKNYQKPISTDCGILAGWIKYVLLLHKKFRLLYHSSFRVIIFNKEASSIEGGNSNLKINLTEIFVIVSQIARREFPILFQNQFIYLFCPLGVKYKVPTL